MPGLERIAPGTRYLPPTPNPRPDYLSYLSFARPLPYLLPSHVLRSPLPCTPTVSRPHLTLPPLQV